MSGPEQVFIPYEAPVSGDPNSTPTDTSEEIVRTDWEGTLHELATTPEKRLTVPRSNDLSRKQVVNAFLDAFELIGGTPRLALWADENPTDFYKIYARLLPQQAKVDTTQTGDVTIRHVLPRTELD